MTADDLAAIIAAHVTRALTPIRQAIAELDAGQASLVDVRERLAGLEARQVSAETIGGLRERLAVLETRAPVPGPPGVDGFGFDDLAVSATDPHTVTFSFSKAGRSREFPIAIPWLVYCGVWNAGDYRPGDVVTWEGSAWVCRAATQDKPGTGPAWTLAVKRGQDGKGRHA